MRPVNSVIGWLALFIVALFLRTGVADDQLRAMIVFDERGHRIEQLFRPADLSPVVPRSMPGSRVRTRPLNSGLPVLSWYSDSGILLLQSSFVDPRVKHVPIVGATSNDNPLQYAVQSSGVYLIAGPGDAARVVIVLPPLNAGQNHLQSEQWTLDLTTYP